MEINPLNVIISFPTEDETNFYLDLDLFKSISTKNSEYKIDDNGILKIKLEKSVKKVKWERLDKEIKPVQTGDKSNLTHTQSNWNKICKI